MGTLGSALIEGRRGKEALPLLQTSLTECRFYLRLTQRPLSTNDASQSTMHCAMLQ